MSFGTQEQVSQKLIEDWNAEIEAGTWLYPEAESQVYYFEPLESTQAPDVCLALDPDFQTSMDTASAQIDELNDTNNYLSYVTYRKGCVLTTCPLV